MRHKPVDAVELNVRVQALTDLQASINERLRMESAWLQAQIRPHFLLNTPEYDCFIERKRYDKNGSPDR